MLLRLRNCTLLHARLRLRSCLRSRFCNVLLLRLKMLLLLGLGDRARLFLHRSWLLRRYRSWLLQRLRVSLL